MILSVSCLRRKFYYVDKTFSPSDRIQISIFHFCQTPIFVNYNTNWETDNQINFLLLTLAIYFFSVSECLETA